MDEFDRTNAVCSQGNNIVSVILASVFSFPFADKRDKSNILLLLASIIFQKKNYVIKENKINQTENS